MVFLIVLQSLVVTSMTTSAPATNIGVWNQPRCSQYLLSNSEEFVKISRPLGGDLACLDDLGKSGNRAKGGDIALEFRAFESRHWQRTRSDDPNFHSNRGKALASEGRLDAAIDEFREALRLRPDDVSAHIGLGAALAHKGQMDAAIAEFREALRLRPDNAMAHYNLGAALAGKGEVDAAITELRKALLLRPEDASAHVALGTVLAGKGQKDAAIIEFREAVRLRSDDALAHLALGTALAGEGYVDGAIVEFREALRLRPEDATAHYDLGTALAGKGQSDAAIAEFREAVRLRSDDALAHLALGTALAGKGLANAAIAEFREAARLRPEDATAHYDLGVALLEEQSTDEAIAEFRKAVQLRPDSAFYTGLATALEGKGEFTEAITVLRKGQQLSGGRPGQPSASAGWIHDVERRAALEARLSALQRGADRPADCAEALDFARICTTKKLHAAAAALYQDVFKQKPELAEDLSSATRYSAAIAAALAGTSRGMDRPPLDEATKAFWRKQALEWLQADLNLRAKQLETGTPSMRNEVREKLQYWLHDPALAGIRDEAEVAKLPESEQAASRRLWGQVERLASEVQRPG
jgi:Flp pilus assembly protein TadD